jgi:hypothetical protein
VLAVLLLLLVAAAGMEMQRLAQALQLVLQ